jgi:CDP-glucose 4,6-dehydratase
VVLNHDFWRGRRVLVTGHTGFKGSWLSLWLESMGAKVTGYSSGRSVGQAPGKWTSLFELARVEEGVETAEGDVTDLPRLKSVVERVKPEVVLHLAAQPLVRRSYADPAGTFETNTIGTVNVLEAVRGHDDVRVVVNVTTDKVYANRELERGYTEDDALGGADPYSASKSCAELVTAAFRSSFFTKDGPAVATARAGNVIGGGDWGVDRLIPDVIRAAVEGRSVPIRSPGAVRPWQHVLNPLSGYLLLAEQLWLTRDLAESWNFGPDPEDAKPVSWILERLRELWGEGLKWEQDAGPHPHETNYLRLDSTKAHQKLGWRPRWNLELALASIVAFHKGVEAGEDARALVLEQIGAYESEMAPA